MLLKRKRKLVLSAKKQIKKYYRKPGGGHKETLPEKSFRELLQSAGYSYHQEYKVAHKETVKSYDFCVYKNKFGYEENVYEWRLLVEVHGDYWHGWTYFEGTSPRSKLSKVQKSNVRNDLLKRKIAQTYGFVLLHVWEHELKNNKPGVLHRLRCVVDYVSQNECVPQSVLRDPYVELQLV